ncbi:unnamed protein product [Oikopleura dioica]|uniref:Uncharacterized protein n=1 Tax=Oikopleura dioica TaxID=34765 RepID=E4WW84_OIKDI|nr:unnamed protein product [Oikopleura dioica]
MSRIPGAKRQLISQRSMDSTMLPKFSAAELLLKRCRLLMMLQNLLSHLKSTPVSFLLPNYLQFVDLKTRILMY